MRLKIFSLMMVVTLTVGFFGSRPARADETWILAAASLKDGLDACVQKFSQSHNIRIKVSYASSSTLARQIEAGAPADIFISADEKWMDEVQSKGLIISASRVNILVNSLVLVAPRASRVEISMTHHLDLVKYLGSGRLAIGDPDYVPAGIYGKAALLSLGAWEGVKNRLAPADDVRAALALVSRGEAPLGIVYMSDAVIDKSVRQVAVFPKDSHPPIIYPAALVKGSGDAGDKAFFAYLKGPEAAAIFHQYGFPLK